MHIEPHAKKTTHMNRFIISIAHTVYYNDFHLISESKQTIIFCSLYANLLIRFRCRFRFWHDNYISVVFRKISHSDSCLSVFMHISARENILHCTWHRPVQAVISLLCNISLIVISSWHVFLQELSLHKFGRRVPWELFFMYISIGV